ncbi:MAG TPA: hypothetical protein PLM56_06745 [Cyclobacteriaceae bacterium]|jgi:hypothetical protein|nr:hypothetical protein [Cytophagales bacterium]HRE67003.1 hypothetical protein [Cyclobacteriaceae bacterium]HRF33177.1 hypothetical protein [Cyclobacteriaceae bacterium]
MITIYNIETETSLQSLAAFIDETGLHVRQVLESEGWDYPRQRVEEDVVVSPENLLLLYNALGVQAGDQAILLKVLDSRLKNSLVHEFTRLLKQHNIPYYLQ